MKELDRYILEKLKIDKNIKVNDRVSFKEALDNMLQSMRLANQRFEWYNIEDAGIGKIYVNTNDAIRINYPEIRDYILKEFEGKYTITNILWSLAKSRITIEYEED